LVRICIPLLLMNFSWIVSANGCRHVVMNHFNLSALCGLVIFYYVFFTSFVIGDLRFSQHLHRLLNGLVVSFFIFYFLTCSYKGREGSVIKKSSLDLTFEVKRGSRSPNKLCCVLPIVPFFN
jgi:hypothetical protein